MADDLKYVITEEERTRHDALFYSQTPKNGLVSGLLPKCLLFRSGYLFVIFLQLSFLEGTDTIFFMNYTQESKQDRFLYAQDFLYPN